MAPLDDGLVARLRTDLGLRESAPVVEGFASSSLLPGRALRVLGLDPFSEGPFRPFVVGGGLGVEVADFLTTPRGIVMSTRAAARAGISVGDPLPVLVGGREWSLPLVGTVDPTDGLARAGLSDVLLMDISGAQEVLGLLGGLSRVDLLLPEGEAGVELEARVRALLEPGQSLVAAGTRTDAMSGMIDAFDVNLTALSLLALVFGMFLIYNAVTFSVVQRRALLGRLRAIGVTRPEVLRLILSEAAWVGLAGSALGLVVGLVLARGLVRLVTRTINDLYFSVSVESVPVEPLLLMKAAVLGVGATLLAALPPALEAAGAQPRVAALRSVVESRARRLVPAVGVVGLAAAALGWVVLELSGRSLAVSFTGLFFVIAGLALVTPLGTLALVRVLRPLLQRLGGTLGLLASRGVVSALSRTAPAIAALVVAVSVTVGLGVMIQSFRGTLERWLDGTLRADIYVSLPGVTASRATGTLWPELIEAYVAHPDVVGHSTYRGIDLLEEDGGYRLVALDLDARGQAAFDFMEGGEDAVMRGFVGGDGVIVSEPFAFRRALGRGDALEVPTPAGPQRLDVLGVFYDYGSDQGAVMMSRDLYDGFFDDRGVTSLALFVGVGVDSETVVDDLLAQVPAGRTVIARTNDTLRSASLEVFDRTFRVTAVLRLLAFIVAFVGVLSALMALELERSRELGVMRAWGLTPGAALEARHHPDRPHGACVRRARRPHGGGPVDRDDLRDQQARLRVTLEMQLGPDILGQAVGLALVGALVAGVYPAWRMSRTRPAVALRGE